MLFNSVAFILLFLPVVVLGYYFLLVRNGGLSLLWLVGASLFFYGWWNPAYLLLLLGSIFVNYCCGRALSWNNSSKFRSKCFVIAGVFFNLLLLGYFKYANFFVENVEFFSGSNFHFKAVVLPLAISFFTFQQIAYLVDVYRLKRSSYGFLEYVLFVAFFPQLIAGPIVHHKEVMPQFRRLYYVGFKSSNIAVGLTIFAVGLAKKVLVADEFALIASPVFDSYALGHSLRFGETLEGVLAYTLQIYFDFSGYSDMAIGLARLFGVRLPVNFNSPYKSTSIIEFWRRWHITLSNFLRDYLYIPLGGNRSGEVYRYRNLFLTMLIGGAWHGAGWNFFIWGALHGCYLIVNHLCRQLMIPRPTGMFLAYLHSAASFLLTFIAVVVAWVFFRAESLESALMILKRLFTLGNWSSAEFNEANLLYLALGMIVCLTLPNTQELLAKYRPALNVKRDIVPQAFLRWRPTPYMAILTSAILVVCCLSLQKESEFIYFQF